MDRSSLVVGEHRGGSWVELDADAEKLARISKPGWLGLEVTQILFGKFEIDSMVGDTNSNWLAFTREF